LGREFGICNVGHIALNSVRVQRMIPRSPSEVGLKTDKKTLNDIFAKSVSLTLFCMEGGGICF